VNGAQGTTGKSLNCKEYSWKRFTENPGKEKKKRGKTNCFGGGGTKWTGKYDVFTVQEDSIEGIF